MKAQHIALAILLMIATVFTANAQGKLVKKENIKVSGECGMCKKKIETAAKEAGATAANWNEKTKILAVSYNSNTDAARIQQAIASAGYDTKDIKATGEAYSKLPECCHYDRKPTTALATNNCCAGEKACDKDMSCCKEGKCKDGGNCNDKANCKDEKCCKS